MLDLKSFIKEKAKEFRVKVENIVELNPQEIKMDLRARWKCMFGCDYYGRASCPPNVPEFDECVRFIKSYKRGLVIIFKFKEYMKDKRKAQKLLLEIENNLVLDHPFAFVIFPGGCDVCETCDGKSCKTLARPSISAMCINADSFGINWRDGYSIGIILID